MRWISRIHPHSRQFVCYLHFIGLDNISLGVSLNWHLPNIEIHLPFCFIRVGWIVTYKRMDTRSFGITYKISPP